MSGASYGGYVGIGATYGPAQIGLEWSGGYDTSNGQSFTNPPSWVPTFGVEGGFAFGGAVGVQVIGH